ncbi:hypothetical protein ES703_89683 [subsurface metagenome]
MRIAIIMVLVKTAIFFCNGVTTFRVSFTSLAILPNSVFSPVATTIPFAEPRVMKVPLKAIQRWSPGDRFGFGIGSTFFSTGIDSPVRAASSALASLIKNRRKSADIPSPPLRRTTSPGTSSRVGKTFCSSSLSTVHSGTIILRSASRAASVFPS